MRSPRASAVLVAIAVLVPGSAFAGYDAVPGIGVHPLPELRSPQPWDVITGSRAVMVAWDENDIAEAPNGYAVTLARPGETNPAAIYRARYAASDVSYPCTARHCSLVLAFPLVTAGGMLLSSDEKYSVSIVTIFADAHRSDGRCDDGTPLGRTTDCLAAVSHAPGWSSAEFLMRDYPWSLRYRDDVTPYKYTLGQAPSRDVLLIDVGTGAVQFVAWNPGAPATTFSITDPRLAGQSGPGVFAGLRPHADPTQIYTISGVFADNEAYAVLTHPTRNPSLPDVPIPGYQRPPYPQSPLNVPLVRPLIGTPV